MIKKIIYWSPRVLAIAYIAFISVFALDVFEMSQWYLALFMHLIPSLILAVLTIIAWKREFIGGIMFLVAGLAMTFFFHSLNLAFPVFVIGALFIASHYQLHLKK